MDAISYTAIRKNLAKTMDRVCKDHAPVIITRQNAGPVVMLSLEDFEGYEETFYLLKSPANAIRLKKAIADDKAGKLSKKELIK
jgi:antitoxin YefM